MLSLLLQPHTSNEWLLQDSQPSFNYACENVMVTALHS